MQSPRWPVANRAFSEEPSVRPRSGCRERISPRRLQITVTFDAGPLEGNLRRGTKGEGCAVSGLAILRANRRRNPLR